MLDCVKLQEVNSSLGLLFLYNEQSVVILLSKFYIIYFILVNSTLFKTLSSSILSQYLGCC